MVNQSGTSEIPSLIPYPQFIPFESCNFLQDQFCYVMKHYGSNGVSLLVYRSGGEARLVLGDWHGNTIDLFSKDSNASLGQQLVSRYGPTILELTKCMGLGQVILFFTVVNGKFMLVDAQLSLNKFAGPGFIRDVFGKIFTTPEVVKIEILNETILDNIQNGSGKFAGNLVIKPSSFKTVVVNNATAPLYVEVIR